MGRLKRLGGRLLLLGGSLVIGLGLLEATTRVLLEVPPQLGVRDPVLGRTYLPGRSVVIRSRESDAQIPLRFNREGFRGPDRPYEKPEGTARVAVIGDSFVAAISVREEQTFVEELQRLLAALRPATRWETMNFGVGASSTGQEWVLYRERVAEYSPDIVLLAFFIGNDLADNSSALSGYPRIYFALDASGQLFQQPVGAELVWSRWLNETSRLYVWQKVAAHKLKLRLRRKAERFNAGERIFLRDPDGDVEQAWRLTERLILAFRDDVAAAGSQLVVALLPPAEQVYDDRWEDLLLRAGDLAPRIDRSYPNRRLSALCERAGIAMISLTEPFRDATGGRPASAIPPEEWLFFNAAGHFTPLGHRLAAETIVRHLAGSELPGDGPLRAAEPLEQPDSRSLDSVDRPEAVTDRIRRNSGP